MAKFGIALGSGPRGLGFESRYSDQIQKPGICYGYQVFYSYRVVMRENEFRNVRLFGNMVGFLPSFLPYELFADGFEELLHAVGAFFLHLIGDMAIDVQGESCGGMAQVFLDGFDVIAGADGGDCVGVPEIMEAGFWQIHAGGDLFECVVDLLRFQVTAQLIGKDKR